MKQRRKDRRNNKHSDSKFISIKIVDQNTGDAVVNSGATKIKITLSEEQLAEFENYTILSVSYSDIAVLNSPEIDENAVEFDIENIESIVFLNRLLHQ